MQLFNSTKNYGAIPQTLHWLTVVLVAVAWALGAFGDVLPKGAPRESGLLVHVTAGIAILMLLAVRLAWRLADPSPPPEAVRADNEPAGADGRSTSNQTFLFRHGHNYPVIPDAA